LVLRGAPADARRLRHARGGGPADHLDAFSTEHRRCGDLDAGVDWPIVWIACPCGASMARRADEDDALATND